MQPPSHSLVSQGDAGTGKPRYSIPIAKPYLPGGELSLIQEVLASGWVSQGPMVQRFEDVVAQYTGAGYAIATTSCTTALHLAMVIHQIGPGDDVICPSYSFIATANGIRHAGATPCFADIDPDTLNLDPKAVERVIQDRYTDDLRHKQTGNRLKGILVVHQIGIPADLDAFVALTKRYNLVLLEDAACALGSRYKNQPVGASGNTVALSFHPRKVITTGEGGMLLTGDRQTAESARCLRAHGASISDLVRHQSASTVFERYEVVGYNYRMTDMQAALGIKQMEILDQCLQRRNTIAHQYNQAFSGLEELTIIQPPQYVTFWNYQSYPIRLKQQTQRDAIMEKLQEYGIATRRGIPPIHLEPVYHQNLHLPQTESVSQHSLFLPIYPQLEQDEVDYVISGVQRALTRLT